MVGFVALRLFADDTLYSDSESSVVYDIWCVGVIIGLSDALRTIDMLHRRSLLDSSLISCPGYVDGNPKV